MRPAVYSADVLRRFLRWNRVATLPQLKELLGTEAAITVFRKLKGAFVPYQLLSSRFLLYPRRDCHFR